MNRVLYLLLFADLVILITWVVFTIKAKQDNETYQSVRNLMAALLVVFTILILIVWKYKTSYQSMRSANKQYFNILHLPYQVYKTQCISKTTKSLNK